MFTPLDHASVEETREFLRRFVENEVHWQERTYDFLQGKELDGIHVITPKVLSVSFYEDVQSEITAKAEITMEYIPVTPEKVDREVMYKIDKWLQSA
jgi:hypothetical protein|uniref:Uncharacterized protein n=1 Tax=viral metagenome TaxID=1070528 RepID=A0A6C0AHB7_9ZZZZ